jgi:oxygen-dependent protoporphyrinogen oxidase
VFLEVLGSSPASNNRFFWYEGQIEGFSSPFSKLARRVLPEVLVEPLRRKRDISEGDESIHDFASRRFGPFAASVLFDAMVTGIYCGDPKLLSLEACLPRLLQLEREHGSIVKVCHADMFVRFPFWCIAPVSVIYTQRLWNGRE